MKLLPISINGHTDYMIDFDSPQYSIEDSFVIASDTKGTLFNFYKYIPLNGPTGPASVRSNSNIDGIMFQTENGPKCVCITEIKESAEDNEHTLRIKLSQDSINDNDKNYELKDLSYDDEQFKITHDLVDDALSLKIIFEYEKWEQSIIVYLAPKGQIRDVVIDCGSEATQMAMFKRNSPCNINERLPILSGILNHFGAEKERHKEYIQAESDNTKFDKYLYKSIFFAKKEIESDELEEENIFPTDEERENENSILRMTTTIQDVEAIRESHLQMYNMKISAFGGVRLPNIELDGIETSLMNLNDFFYRKYLSQFVFQVLRNFCHTVHQPKRYSSNSARILNINVLVPNVYTSERTNKFINCIHEDAIKMVEDNEDFKSKILGVCVTAVSESDASLVGAISLHARKDFSSGTYLVLDAGKGTLDFSVTKYDNGTFKNIMKSGFVGASAAINYGFILDLLEDFIKSNGISSSIDNNALKQFIYENILGKTKEGKQVEGGDLCVLNELMKAIDDYKIRYSDMTDPTPTSSSSSTMTQLHDVKLSAFVEWIKKRKQKIKTNNVNAIISTIINYVYQKIVVFSECDIDYVVFAGRGFLFKPLKDKMFSMLNSLYTGIEEKSFLRELDAVTNKNVCLFIANAISEGKYNNNLLPIPFPIDEEEVEALLNSDFNDYEDIKSNQDDVTSVLQRLTERLNAIVSGFSINVEGKSETKGTTPTTQIDNPFVVGYDINVAPNINIVIGGTFYQLGLNVATGNARLFYSKGKILVRDCENGVHLLTEPTNLTMGLAFPSLFPFCEITSRDEIYIPSITNVNIEDTIKKEKEKKEEEKEKEKEKKLSLVDNLNKLEELKSRKS